MKKMLSVVLTAALGCSLLSGCSGFVPQAAERSRLPRAVPEMRRPEGLLQQIRPRMRLQSRLPSSGGMLWKISIPRQWRRSWRASTAPRI